MTQRKTTAERPWFGVSVRVDSGVGLCSLHPLGGVGEAASTDFCDHYTKLEYKISGDTSDRCDYDEED